MFGAGNFDDAGTERGPVAFEHAQLMGVAQSGGAVEHGVDRIGFGFFVPELRVKLAEKRELAGGCRGEVAGAGDHAAIEQEHRAHFRLVIRA
ncbi:hypothetical protein GCM10022381_35650 [Leifsonia kafniensis]|uniref:Uncharacterized protein n=1 Tax=Leifsonia kafniensis TaxID=475957 RepID=A0ABP7L225_9MICO